MAGAQLTAVLGVVAKLTRRQPPVLVAEQAIAGDATRVELDLQLHVLGDGHHAGAELLDQHPPRLGQAIDVGVDAVAAVGQRLQPIVTQIALAETEHRQEHIVPLLFVDELVQLVDRRDADVEIAVGGQQHAVDTLHPVVAGQLVGPADATFTVRAAGGAQVAEHLVDARLVGAGRPLQRHAHARRVGDDRHAVLRAQLLDQQPHAADQQRQLVARAHRAGHVDQEHEVARRHACCVDAARLDAQPHQLMPGLPRTRPDLGADGERPVAGRLGGPVAEGVDELLEPDGVDRRQLPTVEEAPRVGERGAVHVGREGRQGRGIRRQETTGSYRGVGLQRAAPAATAVLAAASAATQPDGRVPGAAVERRFLLRRHRFGLLDFGIDDHRVGCLGLGGRLPPRPGTRIGRIGRTARIYRIYRIYRING